MPFPAGSIEDVEAWADSEFPAYFAAVNHSPIAHLDTHYFDGEYMDGKGVLQPVLVQALEVGSTANDQVVYARFAGDNNVVLFSEHQIECFKYRKGWVLCMKPVSHLADVQLNSPFCYPLEAGHPAAVDRLETLIRFFYLKHGEVNAVQPRLGFFKAHFRAACRDVARATGVVDEADEIDDDETLPDDIPPDLIADTDTAGLRDYATATAVFNEQVHAMDESYHDFKTSMLRQIGAMQAIERDRVAQIQAQNQDLEVRLAFSERCRTQMEKDLDVQRAKAKVATAEAVSWKGQYEGLKETLQGVLGLR